MLKKIEWSLRPLHFPLTYISFINWDTCRNSFTIFWTARIMFYIELSISYDIPRLWITNKSASGIWVSHYGGIQASTVSCSLHIRPMRELSAWRFCSQLHTSASQSVIACRCGLCIFITIWVNRTAKKYRFQFCFFEMKESAFTCLENLDSMLLAALFFLERNCQTGTKTCILLPHVIADKNEVQGHCIGISFISKLPHIMRI